MKFIASVLALRLFRLAAFTLPKQKELHISDKFLCDKTDTCSFVDIPTGQSPFWDRIYQVSIDSRGLHSAKTESYHLLDCECADGLTFRCDLNGLDHRDLSPSENMLESLNRFEHDLQQSLGVGPRSSCFQKNLGYWTYELCLFKHIRQYHSEKDSSLMDSSRDEKGLLQSNSLQQFVKLLFAQADERGTVITDEYLLGNYRQDLSSEYRPGKTIVQKYWNGDYCEVGPPGNSREVEVHFTCTAKNHIIEIFEVSVCKYVVIFGTPAACRFRETGRHQAIHCAPIDGGLLHQSIHV